MPRKKAARSKLGKLADKIFSEYIRQRGANDQGMAECFTCGKVDHWKRLQNGHFQSRKHYSLRWSEVNCQIQCAGCNVFRYGEQWKFGLYLDKKYGKGTAEKLSLEAKKIVKLSNQDIEEIIEKYKNKIVSLRT